MSCECMGCEFRFVGVGAFDAHRVGRHGVHEGPRRRRCLAADEMIATGWENTPKGWRSPSSVRKLAQKAQVRVEEAA